ncbi:MAG: outer membrane beta-barrel protein [Cytophagales bacterium]
MKKSIYLFAAGVMATAFSFAQETAEAPKKEEGKFSVSGYIDSYYLTALNRPASGLLGGTSGAGRAFDRLTDQFSLGLVQTKFAYSNAKSEMVIDLTFGPNAALGNFGNTGFNPLGYYPSGNGAGRNLLYGNSMAIKQAYFTYKFTDKLSLTVGQFGTHIGYEVIDAPVNFHYSLSNLFNNGPFYHIGAKANYAFSDNFGIMVGLVNNWDALTDWKTQKSIIGQIYIKPVDGWNIYLNAIGGHNDDGFYVNPTKREVDPTLGGTSPLVFAAPAPYNRFLFDLTTGYQITEQFYLGLNAAYGMYVYDTKDKGFDADADGNVDDNIAFADGTFGKSGGWWGVAVYPNFKINDMISIGARLEHFNDEKGMRYLSFGVNSPYGVVNNSATLTAPITLADGHLIIKPEIRFDAASAKFANGTKFNFYENKDGLSTLDPADPTKFTGGSETQTTFGLAFIYKY